MSGHAGGKDLVVLAADKSIEMAIRGILTRQESLGIREVDTLFLVHPAHDPGCVRTPEVLLRPYIGSFQRALVVLDHEGSGYEAMPRTEVEQQTEKLLKRNGWDDRVAVIVIAPELENWVWSDSPQVLKGLGWPSTSQDLRRWLNSKGFWPPDCEKPKRPKEAMESVLKELQRAWSSAIHGQLAENVSLQRCSDPAFQKLRATLRNWFPSD